MAGLADTFIFDMFLVAKDMFICALETFSKFAFAPDET
jgi:hypothetical protein